jgi:hypothetical protein
MIKTSKTRIGIAPWAEGLGSFAVSNPKIFMRYGLLVVKIGFKNKQVSNNQPIYSG